MPLCLSQKHAETNCTLRHCVRQIWLTNRNVATPEHDQERNKSSFRKPSSTSIRERRTMLNKCQIILATGGTVARSHYAMVHHGRIYARALPNGS